MSRGLGDVYKRQTIVRHRAAINRPGLTESEEEDLSMKREILLPGMKAIPFILLGRDAVWAFI